ncbi:MAG: RNA polymerase sigma factor [Prolixibacteraceae bacterium]|jgi:RNA polymerase sigma-70 factor (ECF subfamily)|nr:RNA polymerase sigma factor [Prolixibacteraceae bacterium]
MDSVYIKKVLDGSTEDFRYFIQKYKDLAFSVAVAVVKNEFDAEEVVQEAFIKVFKNLKTFRGKSEFKTWFYRIVINEAFKRLQKEKNDVLLPVGNELPDVEDISETFRGMTDDEQRLLVSESLKKIPSKESLSLQLFYLEGNTISEITGLTGWSEANVKVILHRARKHLLEVVNAMMNNEMKTKAV